MEKQKLFILLGAIAVTLAVLFLFYILLNEISLYNKRLNIVIKQIICLRDDKILVEVNQREFCANR